MKFYLGDMAPDFELPDQDGQRHTLSSYRGKWVLLYFYPKDDTPGCTTEACTIRDQYADFKKAGIVVLGVSADSVDKHKKFAEKHDLPFPLLADGGKAVVKLYHAWGKKKFMGREYDGIFRISFLIDPEGKFVKFYEKVKPADHAGEVFADVKALAKG